MSHIADQPSFQMIRRLLHENNNSVCAIMVVVAWLALYGPVYIDFAQGLWARDENAHGPFILAICAGLAYARLTSGCIVASRTNLELVIGFFILIIGLLLFSWSRIQEVELVLSSTQLIVGGGAVVALLGVKGLRQLWFVFALGLYLVAWPGWVIDFITFPLKLFVSDVVADGLFALGLPVTHEGAVITIGVYELLVADACAGMNSLIALTSIGVVYLYIVKRPSVCANAISLVMLVPIAIIANIIRVTILVSITHYFGYDAGQNFIHDLSGLVMFAVAILGFFVVDAIASRVVFNKEPVFRFGVK